MTIGEWNPEGSKKTTVEIDVEFLLGMVRLVAEHDLEDITALLDVSQISHGAVLMTLDPARWDCISAWDDHQLEALIRFFTIAEMQLPGWQGGKKSPVIALVKLLKKRNAFSQTLRRWIKANTDNRFLPYGSAL
ncbi:MAG: hypothetical protein QGD92_10360 [Gammaproteobacteria bacterium]|nr:hypothetical protein [Gammaproteobacteria bacterium]